MKPYRISPPKQKTVDVHVYFPPNLLRAIRKLAQQNHRSMTGEIVAAVADYVATKNGSRVKERK